MKTWIAGFLCLSCLLFSAPAATRDDAIVNLTGIPIAWNKSRAPTIDEIGQAIVTGCVRRNWQCGITRPGEIRAVLFVRQHMAELRIDYDTRIFSVAYVNSSELRYNASRNTIHRKYNQWVRNLAGDINAAIAALP